MENEVAIDHQLILIHSQMWVRREERWSLSA